MPNIRLILILQVAFIGVFFMSAGEAQAKTYYVSATGDGSCAASSPCSFGTAHTSAVAGDVVEFVGGRHAMLDKIIITKSITLQGSPEGTTVLDFEDVFVGHWLAAVMISASNVTLKDLSIENVMKDGTTGSLRAVMVNASWDKGPIRDNITIQRVNTKNTYGAGMAIGGASNTKILDCKVSYAMQGRGEGRIIGWESGISILRGDNVLVKGCEVSYVKGEGILVVGLGNNINVEDNIVHDTINSGIYTSAAKNIIIRRNIVYHTETVAQWSPFGSHYYLQPNDGTPAINVGGEVSGYAQAGTVGVTCTTCLTSNYGIRVYNNVTANYPKGLSVWAFEQLADCPGDCGLDDILIFNNTFIGENPAIPSASVLTLDARGSSDVNNKIFNNIFWNSFGKLASIIDTEATVGPNTFNKDPGDSEAKHIKDPSRSGATYAVLDIANYFQKTLGWSSITPGSIANMNNWQLRSTAAHAIDDSIWVTNTTSGGSGTVIPVTALPSGHRGYFHTGDVIQFQGKNTPMTVVSSTNNIITVNTPQTWTNGLGIGLAYSGSSRDNGALEYVSGDNQTPNAPSGLSVR